MDDASVRAWGSWRAQGETGLQLKGLHARPEVGFLSHMEALRYVVVGEYFKCPTHAVWVVQGENHYSVLFADSDEVDTTPSPRPPAHAKVAELSPTVQAEQDLQRAFNTVDTTEAGMIPLASLGEVLQLVGLSPEHVGGRATLPGTDVVLWGTLRDIVLPLLQQQGGCAGRCKVG